MKKERGFTLIELLVVVAIIALLIAILLPSLGRARERANTTKCLANIKAFALSVSVYAGVSYDYCPPAATGPAAGQVDYMYYPLIAAGAITNPNLADNGFTTNGTGLGYPGLNLRSVFMCPDTPNYLNQTISSTGTLIYNPPSVPLARDGYFEDAAWNYDSSFNWVSAPPLAPNSGKRLILQASYGFNGSATSETSPNFYAPLQSIMTVPGSNYTCARKLASIPAPALMVFMYDGGTDNPWGGVSPSTDIMAARIAGRHGSRSPATTDLQIAQTGDTNIAFFDGHAETAHRVDLPYMPNELTGPPNSAIVTMTVLKHGKYFWRMDQASQ